ncbi:PQQ-dependent sugar dehydrogenase [Patescibacteria group bacterium]|nr:PQQ-dependent sugar dehydrogenase [Patescibacteria group bacterium]
MLRNAMIIGASVLAVGVIIYTQFGEDVPRYVFAPTGSSIPIVENLDAFIPEDLEPNSPPLIKTVIEGLAVPWDLVFLPDSSFLVTERPGSIRRVMPNGNSVRIEVPNIQSTGEGGLLGIALHPRFAENQFIYLYQTSGSGNDLHNKIVRFRFDKDILKDPRVIVDQIPGAIYHDGGELAFGPDGYLYATAGDAGRSDLAQNPDSLAGKVLRMTDEGKSAPGNPFETLVYSYGHRNGQGLAWDSEGRLWATEHGRSGVTSGYDEVNRIESGKNYGWPTIQGSAQKEGLVTPQIQSGEKETWAPSGIAIVGDRLFFVGLRGESLYEVQIQKDGNLDVSSAKAYFRGVYGRLRGVVLGPDGALYLTTSNTDGRGFPKENDDRVLRVDLKALK